MRENHRGRRAIVLAAMAMLSVGSGSVPVTAADTGTADPGIPVCQRVPLGPGDPPDRTRPPARPLTDDTPRSTWSTALDASGAIAGHTLRLGSSGTWVAGPRAFADGPFGDILVTGERYRTGTRLRLIDLERGCASRVLSVRGLVYGSAIAGDGSLVVSLVDPRTRAELGVWQLGPRTDAPQRIVAPPTGEQVTAVPRDFSLRVSPLGVQARWCAAGSCVARGHGSVPNGLAALVDLDPDAETDSAASLPLRSPRPVPVYDRWFPWSVLSYRFHATDVSPSWMRQAVEAAADDATDTSRSLSPIFSPGGSSSGGVIRYTASFPASCANAIACASHDADQWTLRMRPQGFDFRWGALRWCQKATADGCFDAERVALHEFGHVVGLDHPEAAGFRLAPSSTVMHQVTASRPHTAWDRHGFGQCDVASLQEQFGTPTMSTLISSCNDVDTRVTLSVSATSVGAGQRLTLTATLRVRTDSAYRLISGMRLNDRSVQLRRRPAGSTAAWTTSWMRWAEAPGLYTATLYPRAGYEYQAVFSAPDNEGLNGDVSDVMSVRVSGACSGLCPNEEDPS